jgi:hypothetical protein
VTRRTVRRIGFAVAALSVATLAVSALFLARTIAERNVDAARFMGRVAGASFTFGGHEGSVERFEDASAAGLDSEIARWGAIRLTWRGQSKTYPVWMEPEEDDDGDERHDRWLGILWLAEGAGSEAEFRERWTPGADGEVSPDTRLVIAARFPAEGWDPGTWGLVRKSEWVYELVELRTDGPDATAMVTHRRTFDELDALTGLHKRNRLENPPTEAERRRDLWMHVAMEQVTPPSQYRGRTKAIDEVVRSMGWPWKAAVASVMGIVVGLLLAAASGPRPEDPLPG